MSLSDRKRPCPTCGADRGMACTTITGIPMNGYTHRTRKPWRKPDKDTFMLMKKFGPVRMYDAKGRES